MNFKSKKYLAIFSLITLITIVFIAIVVSNNQSSKDLTPKVDEEILKRIELKNKEMEAMQLSESSYIPEPDIDIRELYKDIQINESELIKDSNLPTCYLFGIQITYDSSWLCTGDFSSPSGQTLQKDDIQIGGGLRGLSLVEDTLNADINACKFSSKCKIVVENNDYVFIIKSSGSTISKQVIYKNSDLELHIGSPAISKRILSNNEIKEIARQLKDAKFK